MQPFCWVYRKVCCAESCTTDYLVRDSDEVVGTCQGIIG